MTWINSYSLAHFFIWFIAGRFTQMTWTVFLLLSVSWELLEWVLPFNFAQEWIGNKLADVVVNILSFSLGKRLNTSSRPESTEA